MVEITSNPSLETVIERRKSIAAEIDRWRARMDHLRAEDAELEMVAGVLQRLATTVKIDPMMPLTMPAQTQTPASMAYRPPVPVSDVQRSKGSIEELIVTHLLENPKTAWLTATDVRDWLVWRTGRDVPMSTVSPTLSNLKNKKLIVRDGLKVAATERVVTRASDQITYDDGVLAEIRDRDPDIGEPIAGSDDGERDLTDEETLGIQTDLTHGSA